MRIGAHVPMHKSAKVGKSLEAEVVQIHLGSPRQWQKAEKPKGDTFSPFYVHAPYLINLSAADPECYLKSVHCLREQASLAASLGAKGLVIHGGSWKKGDKQHALAQWAEAFLLEFPLPILIENAANGTHSLTRKSEDLVELMHTLDPLDLTGERRHDIGWCLDTAHLWAASSDPSSELSILLRNLDFPNLIHANGSKVAQGSGKDQHSPYAGSESSLGWIWEVIRACETEDIIVESTDPVQDIKMLKHYRTKEVGLYACL